MNKNFDLIKKLNANSRELCFSEKKIILLEGEISDKIYYIEEGCLRLSFNKEGKDITLQFFFENQIVSSFESFYLGEPSLFSIESVEKSKVRVIDKKEFDTLLKQDIEFNSYFTDFLAQRFVNYNKLFLSRIKDSAEERYIELIKNNPSIVERIPLHYIASYLGITSVSLSRIRTRLSSN